MRHGNPGRIRLLGSAAPVSRVDAVGTRSNVGSAGRPRSAVRHAGGRARREDRDVGRPRTDVRFGPVRCSSPTGPSVSARRPPPRSPPAPATSASASASAPTCRPLGCELRELQHRAAQVTLQIGASTGTRAGLASSSRVTRAGHADDHTGVVRPALSRMTGSTRSEPVRPPMWRSSRIEVLEAAGGARRLDHGNRDRRHGPPSVVPPDGGASSLRSATVPRTPGGVPYADLPRGARSVRSPAER